MPRREKGRMRGLWGTTAANMRYGHSATHTHTHRHAGQVRHRQQRLRKRLCAFLRAPESALKSHAPTSMHTHTDARPVTLAPLPSPSPPPPRPAVPTSTTRCHGQCHAAQPVERAPRCLHVHMTSHNRGKSEPKRK